MAKDKLGGEKGFSKGGVSREFSEKANEIRQSIRRLKNERAFIVDEKGNVIAELRGREDEVITPKEVINEVNRKIYDLNQKVGYIHNHPSGSTFSPEDVYTMVKRSYGEMQAVTKNGTYILRSKTGGGGSMVLSNGAQERLARLQLGEALDKARAVASKRNFDSFQARQKFISEYEFNYINTEMDKYYRKNADKNGFYYTFVPNKR